MFQRLTAERQLFTDRGISVSSASVGNEWNYIKNPKQICAGFHRTCRAPLGCITISVFFVVFFFFSPSRSQHLQTGTRHWAILLVPLIAKSFWLWSEATTVKLQSDASSVAWREHWAPSEQSDHCSTCQVLRGLRLHFNGQKWRRRWFWLWAAGARATLDGGSGNWGFALLKCQSRQVEEPAGPRKKGEIRAFTLVQHFQQIFWVPF